MMAVSAQNAISARLINLALLLLIGFIWASAFGAIKVAVVETGPITAIFDCGRYWFCLAFHDDPMG